MVKFRSRKDIVPPSIPCSGKNGCISNWVFSGATVSRSDDGLGQSTKSHEQLSSLRSIGNMHESGCENNKTVIVNVPRNVPCQEE